MADFAADISAFVKKANGNVDKAVRTVVLEIGKRVVERSPVGDPKLWTSLGWYQLALTASGKQRKYQTLKSMKKAPKGYTGGRFRANWQHGFGQIPSGDLPDIDKSGSASLVRIAAGVKGSAVAGIHYLANNLPYSRALENGHSTQAPAGMVGLTAIEFQQVTRDAAAEANK